MMTAVSKNIATAEVPRELDINLRSSCLACSFITSCAVAERKSSPDYDVLIGSYRINALKERCLL